MVMVMFVGPPFLRRAERCRPGEPGAGHGGAMRGIRPARINRSVELIVQPDANDRASIVEIFIMLIASHMGRLDPCNCNAAKIVIQTLYFCAPIVGECVFKSAAHCPARFGFGSTAGVNGTGIRCREK